MNAVNLICTDIDGTLNSPSLRSHNIISNENVSAIKKYLTTGNKLILATGRKLDEATQLADQLEDRLGFSFIPYIICLNGACVFDNFEKQVVHTLVNDQHVTNRVINFLKGIKAHIFVIDSLDVLYYKRSFISRLICKFYFKKRDICPLDFSKIPVNVQKIMVFAHKANAFELKEQILKNIDGVYVACSGKYFLEIIDLNINKFYALEKVLGYMNVDIENTCAIGNEGNDVMMIEKVGFGVGVDFEDAQHLKYDKDKIQFFTSNKEGMAVRYAIEELFRLNLVLD